MELQTGGNAATMSLELYDKEDTLIAKLDNDSASLGSYAVSNGMRLHVSLFRFIFWHSFKIQQFKNN